MHSKINVIPWNKYSVTPSEKNEDIFSKMLVTCFVDDMDETDDMKEPSFIEVFSKWIDKKSRKIKGYPQFRKEVQEDPHEVMLTEDNFNVRSDPFVKFITNIITIDQYLQEKIIVSFSVFLFLHWL